MPSRGRAAKSDTTEQGWPAIAGQSSPTFSRQCRASRVRRPTVTDRSPAPQTSPAAAATPPQDPPARSEEITAIKAALNSAIKRSLDEAFQQLSVPVQPPQEELIAARVTREASIAIEQTISASYVGPMPPPPMLRQFDQVVPGLAREIADSARDEQRHRHRWENKALWSDIFVQSGGLFLGWALRLAAPLQPGSSPFAAITSERASC